MDNQSHIQFLIENIENACIIVDEKLYIKRLNENAKRFFEELAGIHLCAESDFGDYLLKESKEKLKKISQRKVDFSDDQKIQITFSHLDSTSTFNSRVRRFQDGAGNNTIIILETNPKIESTEYNTIDSTHPWLCF